MQFRHHKSTQLTSCAVCKDMGNAKEVDKKRLTPKYQKNEN